jgi:hypothetical protein
MARYKPIEVQSEAYSNKDKGERANHPDRNGGNNHSEGRGSLVPVGYSGQDT